MLKNRIIPCLDVKNGRVVKGINFIDLKDAGDPVEQAKIYSDGGADEICFLDITASNENRDTIYDVVEKTSKKCFVPLTVGGGVRSVDDINKLLNCGADKVSINTAAVQNPEVVVDSSKKFGSQCIVVAIDAKKNGDKWEVFTHGGRNNTGIDAIEFAKKLKITAEDLGIPFEMLSRSVNEGFSGGEKKRYEILQMSILNPSLAILDETDSGLDVDAFKTITKGVNKIKNKNNSFLIITHYEKLLENIIPNFIHIMKEGKIIKTGDKTLAKQIEKEGFQSF